jgi:hypothetical protein
MEIKIIVTRFKFADGHGTWQVSRLGWGRRRRLDCIAAVHTDWAGRTRNSDPGRRISKLGTT